MTITELGVRFTNGWEDVPELLTVPEGLVVPQSDQLPKTLQDGEQAIRTMVSGSMAVSGEDRLLPESVYARDAEDHRWLASLPESDRDLVRWHYEHPEAPRLSSDHDHPDPNI